MESPQVFDMTVGVVSGAKDVSPLGASIGCNTLPLVLCPGRGDVTSGGCSHNKVNLGLRQCCVREARCHIRRMASEGLT